MTSNPITYQLHKDKVDTEPLSLDEVRLIRNKCFSSVSLNNIKDLFIVQCYTGLAYKDLVTFKKDDIKIDRYGKEWILKNRYKTGVPAYIPILPVVKEIFERYQYKLPTLSNQKYNSYLKEIQQLCRINKTLHTHLARHTLGSLLLNAGVDMASVSRILGHSSIRITESVYAKMLPETIMSNVDRVSDYII